MRFVMVSTLLGFAVALTGLAFFGMDWATAGLIWLLSSPLGAVMALLASLTPPSDRTKAPLATGAQQQAA
jgi:hypothetical protein